MTTCAVLAGAALLVAVLVGAIRGVVEAKPLFLREVNEGTRHAYLILAIAGALLLMVGLLDSRRFQSIEVVGLKASLGELTQRVDTLAQQIEAFYESERTETFGKGNWDRVRVVGKVAEGYRLEVMLEQAPIPASVRVHEGVLELPRLTFQIDEKRLVFLSNIDRPYADYPVTLTVYYHPRSTRAGTTPTSVPK